MAPKSTEKLSTVMPNWLAFRTWHTHDKSINRETVMDRGRYEGLAAHLVNCLCCTDECLGGYTAHVEAVAAKQVALNDGNAGTHASTSSCSDQPTRASTNDHHVVCASGLGVH